MSDKVTTKDYAMMSDKQLNQVIGEKLGYELRQDDEGLWTAYLNDRQVKVGGWFQPEYATPRFAEDLNDAIKLAQEFESFRLTIDGDEWEALIGHLWDDRTTAYSYRDKRPSYAICRAWLAWKDAQS